MIVVSFVGGAEQKVPIVRRGALFVPISHQTILSLLLCIVLFVVSLVDNLLDVLVQIVFLSDIFNATLVEARIMD